MQVSQVAYDRFRLELPAADATWRPLADPECLAETAAWLWDFGPKPLIAVENGPGGIDLVLEAELAELSDEEAAAFRDGGTSALEEVVRRLRTKGVTLQDSLIAGARPLMGQELGLEVARYVFGRPAEFRRRMGDDPQVQQALALARRAKSPADLLARVAAVPPSPSRN